MMVEMPKPGRKVQPPADYVHDLVESWRRERPDLPVEPLEIVYRTARLASHFAAEIDKAFAGTAVSPADFAVLANLRRAGTPFQLSQRQLMGALGLTSGTVSVRIDRLENGGLVERHPDPVDARGVLVTLTEEGSVLFNELAPRHLANEGRLVAALGPEERTELARTLQLLLVEYEPMADRPGSTLGVTVAPAHVGIERRTAMGLPATDGLLVEAVVPGSPAAGVGLRPGDVLTHAGTTPLRSLSCLTSAIADVTDITLRYERNSEHRRAALRLLPG